MSKSKKKKQTDNRLVEILAKKNTEDEASGQIEDDAERVVEDKGNQDLAGDSRQGFVKKELEVAAKKFVSSEKAAKKKKHHRRASADSENGVLDGRNTNEKKIERELEEIYGNDDGTMPDMKNFERKKRNRAITALVALVVSCSALAVVAWAGFFIFQPQSRFSEEDVILSISGDEEIMSGQEVRYRIRYRNSQNVPLAKVALQIRYPEGFVFKESNPAPANDNNDEWTIGSLEEQASGYIDIFGKLYGDLERKQSFRVFLNYIPSNFSSEFQKIATISAAVTQSPLSLIFEGPADVVVGAEAEFVITVNKEKDDVGEHLAVVLEPSGGFTIKSSDPAADESDHFRWSIKDLNEEKKITIRGVFAEESGKESVEITVKVLGWKDENRSENGYVLAAKTQTVAITQTGVSANLVINGTLSDFSAQPGDVLYGSIAIKNAGQGALEDISASIIFDAPSFDGKSILKWEELEDKADGRIAGEQRNNQTRRGSITWGKGQIGGLRKIAAGGEATIDFSIPIKSAADIDLTDFSTYEIQAVVELQYDTLGEHDNLSSNQIKMIVNSDIELGVQDEIGQTDAGKDKHRVTWILNNSFHELKNISLEADIYGDIKWLEEALTVPAGEAVFDQDKQRLTWTVESMPTSLDVLALQFGVELNSKNPSQTNLASKVRFKATDAITGEEIILVGDEVLLSETGN
ncbi:MAG: hypothetical protein WC618_03670 [Patescibacteria group bacterium]